MAADRANPDILSQAHSVRQESNRVGTEFLQVEVRTALTFLDVAETTDHEETRDRNLKRARYIYEKVCGLLPQVSPSAKQYLELSQSLARLRARLNQAGLLVEEQ